MTLKIRCPHTPQSDFPSTSSSPSTSNVRLPAETAIASSSSQVHFQDPGIRTAETTNSEDQSPKAIESSADKSTTEFTAKLFVNYPPNRPRSNINKRRQPNHTTCLSYPSSPSTSVSDDMRRFRPPLAREKQSASSPTTRARFSLSYPCERSARLFSNHFPEGHELESEFVEAYQLQDELGAGGYGFVMTAIDRYSGLEVAVKFIIKDKVPEHSWIHDPTFGKLPMEVVLLSFVNHDNIVKCLDVFEDPVYFYLVQELHGSPWNRSQAYTLDWPTLEGSDLSSASLSTPSLSPSTSETSLAPDSPRTPPHRYPSLPIPFANDPTHTSSSGDLSPIEDEPEPKHQICKRPSYDLFECIEQSERKRLTEEQARYVFAQVVDAVYYLDSLGISHRDIKDENLVIDHDLKIKLIDFGSATIVDPSKPRPYYDLFYGTAAYASSEILLKKKYQAAPAEVWTLGVLLSYLLAGVSPFPTIRDAVDGRIFLSESLGLKPSESAMDLLRACLDPNPETRITIAEVAAHPWLQQSHISVVS
ncbi:CAMK/CAMKL/PASK protein kinase [Coprinopsis cinerea okayama7|uniref:CAMK/CAMKL/PASK protein kinase n=1 Tax=Coprinopsis cinerea (strain Okayama-7 / 130 / ATCC MYA-4618 / FGSC 9003) TaxID=240176 RepID=A8N5M4_COPC7|nr:CAMK/CAMKL/PASK protein kinase [Coprinopsis cinerea okayama7\|eukprot:XP_001830169.2 CAMK/CAMKL/PASK protein kinase [Coprinopsis cinerea okayama7\